MPKKKQSITLRDIMLHIQAMKQELLAKIDGVEHQLTVKIDGVEHRLTVKIDGVESRLTRVERKVDLISTQIKNIDERLDDIEVKRLPKLEVAVFGKP